MSYEIDSNDITFNGKDLKSFFASIQGVCESTNTKWFIVGAFARDMVLENIFGQPTGIATRDIDIAIRIDSWENYKSFIEILKSKYKFRSGRNPHEFISPEEIYTDILPYGRIEEERSISFPAIIDREINMLGFEKIYDSTLQIRLDQEVEFNVASIEGICILKFIAWKDRSPDRVSAKHTRDIGLIINAYFEAMVSEFAIEFADLFDEENFDSQVCGARALGRRIKQLAFPSKDLLLTLEDIFTSMIEDEDNALFVSQMVTVTNWEYAFSLRLLKSLILGFRESPIDVQKLT